MRKIFPADDLARDERFVRVDPTARFECRVEPGPIGLEYLTIP